MSFLFILRAATATVGAISVFLDGRSSALAEFTGGKRHTTEHTARIVFLYRCAFLFGNTVFHCLHQILRGANNANDGEDPQRNGEKTSAALTVTAVVKAQRGIQGRHHSLGKAAFAATAAVAIARSLHDATSQKHRLYHLYNRPLIGMLFMRSLSSKNFGDKS
jgi:hypothetical protein